MKQENGFSLIELMITLSIASILLGYALPNLNQLKLTKYIESERDRLTVALNFARSHAIISQDYVILCPSTNGSDCNAKSDWDKGWIVFVDHNKNRTVDNNDDIIRHEGAMKNEIKSTSSVYRQKIRYDSMGFSPGTNLSINFCDSRGYAFAKSIIINNSGRIKQSSPISDNVCN